MHISVLFAHIFFGFLLVSTNGMCWKIPGGSIEGVHSDSTTRSDVVCCWIFLDLFFPINMWDIWLPPRKPLRNPYVLIVFKELISIKRCVFDADWPRAGSKFSMTSTEGLWDPIGWSAGSLPLAWIKKTSRQGSGIMGIMVRTLPPKATKTNGFLTNLKPWFGWVGWVCFAKKVFVMMRRWLDILLITMRKDSRLKPSLRFPSRCVVFFFFSRHYLLNHSFLLFFYGHTDATGIFVSYLLFQDNEMCSAVPQIKALKSTAWLFIVRVMHMGLCPHWQMRRQLVLPLVLPVFFCVKVMNILVKVVKVVKLHVLEPVAKCWVKKIELDIDIWCIYNIIVLFIYQDVMYHIKCTKSQKDSLH